MGQNHSVTPDPTASDYYRRVGSTTGASAAEVRQAVRAQQKSEHPDRSDQAEARTRFQRVMTAADCLTDPEERAAYDTFRERFADRAAAAYEQWVAYGRPPTPRTFSPPRVTVPTDDDSDDMAHEGATAWDDDATDGTERESSAATAGSGATTTSSGGGTAGTTDSTARSVGERARNGSKTTGQTGSNGTGWYDSTAPGNHGPRERSYEDWYSHRQSYERPSYTPPRGVIRPWLQTEAHLLWRELLAGAGLAVVAGVSVLVLVVVVLAAGFLTLLLGAVLAIPEFLLRSAGIVRFDAFTVVSVGLTWLLEVGTYLLAAGVAWMAFERLCQPESESHLGNRLRLPELLYALPVGVAFIMLGGLGDGLGAVTVGSVSIDLSPPTLSPVTRMAGATGATWMACHRVVRIARETPSVGHRESLRGSIATGVWIVTVGSLLLAVLRRGMAPLAAGITDPYGETLVWAWLTPDRLVAGAVLVTGGWILSVTAVRFGGWLCEHIR